jgi:hypothetical protein
MRWRNRLDAAAASFLYEEDQADLAGKRFIRSAIWRSEPVAPSAGCARMSACSNPGPSWEPASNPWAAKLDGARVRGLGLFDRFLHSRHPFDHGHDVFDGSLNFCNELIGLRGIDARNRRVTQYLTYPFVSGLNLFGSASSYAMHIVIEVSDQIFLFALLDDPRAVIYDWLDELFG